MQELPLQVSNNKVDHRSYYLDMKPYQFERMFTKYKTELLNLMFKVIVYNKAHKQFPCELVYPMSIKNIRLSMGKTRIHGRLQYIWDLVQERTPIVAIIWHGSNHQGLVSAVKIIDWGFIVDSLNEKLELEEFKKYQLMKSNLWDLHIDLKGLTCLKTDITKELITGKISEYRREMLSRQLFWTEALLTYCPDGVLNQYCEEAITGRLYIKGLNLQNAPKRVRSVALGQHYLYDFKACAFGVFVSLYYVICEHYGYDASVASGYLRDYIVNRERIRVQIVRDLYYPTDTLTWSKKSVKFIKGTPEYKKVKTAFTAMGFGARPLSGFYPTKEANGYNKTAITKIFNVKEDADKFLEHPLVSGIVRDLKTVTKIILEFYKQNDPDMEIVEGKPYDQERGKSREARLAHIYQGHEVKLLGMLLEAADKIKLLPLHDGIATSHKISSAALVELKQTLKVAYPFVELADPEYKGSYTRDLASQTRITEHKIFMKDQERAASDYVGQLRSGPGTEIKI